ncbi:hypothetical protein M5D96_001117 [Drosophila gunungcola]|uniref:Protein TsetseEP domain-containing protein n=1 Tax=Drosophila gunungcola TaxID=103775 RepID=A0A9P9YXK7_9MUSC|nr:hypothetical protein M5D96_001117 [Drosophila gunungcola]
MLFKAVTLFLAIGAVYGAVVPNSVKISGESTLIEFLRDSPALRASDHADKYDEDSRTCNEDYEVAKSLIDSSYDYPRNELADSVKNTCYSLLTCDGKESNSDAFECLASGGPAGSAALGSASDKAYDYGASLKERLGDVKKIETACLLEAQRTYKTNHGQCYDDLIACAYDPTWEFPTTNFDLCFQIYRPLLENVAARYETNFEACITGYDNSTAVVNEKYSGDRQNILKAADIGCARPNSYCTCWTSEKQDLDITFYGISANATEIAVKIKEEYRVLESRREICENNAERTYVEDTADTYERLNNCLKGIPDSTIRTTTPYPTTFYTTRLTTTTAGALCFGHYIPILNGLSAQLEVDYAKCQKYFDDSSAAVIASWNSTLYKIQLTGERGCSTFFDCSSIVDFVLSFECFANVGAEQSKTMYQVSADATEAASDIKITLQTLDTQMINCQNNADRHYVEETASTYEKLNRCLGGTPLPQETTKDWSYYTTWY